MKLSSIKQIIKEEIQKAITEAHLEMSNLKKYIVKDTSVGGMFGTIEIEIPEADLAEMEEQFPDVNKEIIGTVQMYYGANVGIKLNGEIIKQGIDL